MESGLGIQADPGRHRVSAEIADEGVGVCARIEGWTFKPGQGVFHPEGLKQADELAGAALA